MTAYVGTYAPNGGGIHAFGFEPGAPPPPLAGEARVADGDSPSWLTANAAGTRLYAVHELHRAPGSGEGRISSYEIGAGGRLRRLGCTSSGGVRPVHLSLHPGGRHAFVAHYDSGDVAVLGVDGDGCIGPLLERRALAEACGNDARPGPAQAARAPRGSFACSGHDAPHAHIAVPDPSGRFLLCTDLGLDVLVAWRFDAGRGRLEAPRAVRTSSGAGPRHLVFHPHDPTRLYLLNEEASTLAWLRFDGGELQALGEASCLPAAYAGTAYASDLCCSADGRHLYALNRLHDSIAHFTLAPDGTPQLQGTEWCRGSYPRTLRRVPGGGLVVCNERSDHLAWFQIGGDGTPRFAGHYTGVGGAASVVFVGT
nr:lactonase family protein [Aquabacterium terrae]